MEKPVKLYLRGLQRDIGNFVTRNPVRTLNGLVDDSRITSVKIIRNVADTVGATATGGKYSISVNLV
jgi:hypothetical protein